jgi:ParB family transcriptional regulator, chromosome partitioning protein
MGKMQQLKSALGNALNTGIVDLPNQPVTHKEKTTNKKLEAARDGRLKQETIIAVNPKRCRLWSYHNRDQRFLTPENCADIIESMKSNGQDTPALVRELINDPDYDYELIYGSRRRFSCEYLGKQLNIRLTTEDDMECAAKMDIENRARKDISDYERALDYKNWLDKGLYRTITSIAEKIGVNKGWASKIVRLADLPDQIVNAFTSPLDIKIHYGPELFKLLDNENTREKILRKSKELHGKNFDGQKVFRTLLACNVQAGSARTNEFSVIQVEGKRVGDAIIDNKGRLQIRLDKGIKPDDLDSIKKKISEILEKHFSK